MAIEIKEYLNYKIDSRNQLNLSESSSSMTVPRDYLKLDLTNALNVDIEGIHVVRTGNHNIYTKEALESSMNSWLYPYAKPLIMHHNEDDGKTIGRIQDVELIEKSELSRTPAILFNVNVTDKEGIEQVKDGRLLTTSVGVTAKDVRCTICHKNIAEEGFCEHEKGQVYNGETCCWEIREMVGKELSYVIVPSDPYARNIKINDNQDNNSAIKIAESQEKTSLENRGGNNKMGKDNPKDQASTIKGLKELIKSLEEDVKDLKYERDDLKEDLKEAENKIAGIEELNKEEIESLKAKLDKKKLELNEEKALRESLENTIMEIKESEKKELVDEFVKLRKEIGKVEIAESAIITRSVESLKNSIEDMKMDLAESKEKGTSIQFSTVPDPTVQNIQEGKSSSNEKSIDLREGLEGIFSSTIGRFY